MQTRTMNITFGGGTQIDVSTMITALTNFEILVNRANSELGGGEKRVDVKINAIKEGSFSIDISLVENLTDTLKSIFSPSSVAYMASLAAVVGGCFKVYKHLRGRKAKEEEAREVINNINVDNSVEIGKVVLNVYNDKQVRTAISDTIKAAREENGVTDVQFDMGEEKPTVFDREDFDGYVYDGIDDDGQMPGERTEERDVMMTITKLSFENNGQWSFVYDGFKINMTVNNPDLLETIDRGERFGKGDAVSVRLLILQRYDPVAKAYINKSFRIAKYYGHIKAPEQGRLDL